ncbi:MAG: hypothetical protein NC084_12510 [Bacteroides sp.]|nr:hypothetical protein [Eubacterium sp.]MCM1417725.1 hypothetical protein [Roseburia sp.]MCM1463515.1 hypothetical protein [Bacteroides sp.]
MGITANVGGVLKTLRKVTANVSGVLKGLNPIHANVNGILKVIHGLIPDTITGSNSTSAMTRTLATGITLYSTCTITFSANITGSISNYSTGARTLIIVNASNEDVFQGTVGDRTDMYKQVVLPAGVYSIKVAVFDVYRTSYAYPTVTYTITFS